MLASNRCWKPSKLGEYFRIMHGYAFKGKFFAQEGQYIVLTPGNFNPDGGIKLKGEKEKYYTSGFPDEYLLKSGELLVVMTDLTQNAPILGSPAFVPDDDKFLHNQRLGKVVELDQSSMNRRFLYYLFNSHSVRAQIKATATGATVRHTAPSRIYDVKVEVPPLPTQRKIAAILSAYDDLIENNTRRIAILEEMAQNLYREWFVHFRFPGHESVPLVDSDVGPIPERWEVRRIGQFGQVLTGKTPSKKVPEYYGDYMPFVKIPDMRNNIFVTGTSDTLSKAGADSQKNKTLPANSLCVSCIGSVGLVAITTASSQTNQQINSIIPANEADREFLYFALRGLSEVIHRFGATGATMANLSRGKFIDLEITYPDEETLLAFHELTHPMFENIRVLQSGNELLRRTRDLLLPRLISGQLDVSDLPIDTGGLEP